MNVLGWQRLHPLQEEAIEPLLEGQHALLLAPTAGGKTEAAIFPVLSRMASEAWHPLSVLYLAPLRALLNNLLPRLERYASFTGHCVALWHGDTTPSQRTRIIADPPDVLLTTPESLEAMLISRRVNERWLFPNLRTVIVDEVHSFAAGDRGWHMRAVLERLTRLCGRELQRIGLSATVGNPEELLEWLVGPRSSRRVVVSPPARAIAEPEVSLDYVGTLDNAAVVISRLHRGEKRLVFVDSRRRAEELALALRGLDVTVFVSHGSLGRDERHRTERAFSEGDNCVIVATSTLELGIDIGDLDRVIQIDSPSTVAGFLQRIGRTGRREGSSRNALFLATSPDALLHAAGLLRLWRTGYVEPAIPPPFPLHLLAQQVLGLALQEADDGLGKSSWTEWLGDPPALGSVVLLRADALVEHLVEAGWLFADGDLLSVGPETERRFGTKNFLELMSAFVSDPMYSVRHGRNEIGQIPDEALIAAFQNKHGPPALLLGGRSWLVLEVDWRRRVVRVQPDERPGKVRYSGLGQPLSYELCQSIAAVVAGEDPHVTLTRRAVEELATTRAELPRIDPSRTTLAKEVDGSVRWWTFAGLKANVELAARLSPIRDQITQRSNLYITLAPGTNISAFSGLIDREASLTELLDLAPWATASLKLANALPEEWAQEVAIARISDPKAVQEVLARSLRQMM